MDVLNNNALTQLVEEPTRQQNTMDLILTNHPDKIIRTDFSACRVFVAFSDFFEFLYLSMVCCH
jgi:hypothetical protein